MPSSRPGFSTRLARHLLSPDDEAFRLRDDEARFYQAYRLVQMHRGWTMEYAENLIQNRPEIVMKIFQANEAQNKTDAATGTRHIWWS